MFSIGLTITLWGSTLPLMVVQLAVINYLLCVSQWARHFKYLISFSLHNNIVKLAFLREVVLIKLR